MKSTGLIQLVGKLHQAGRIHNLHQVCGVFGCVLYIRLQASCAFHFYAMKLSDYYFTIVICEKSASIV